MAFKRPPKGYLRDDQPLPHNFGVTFEMGMESGAGHEATYVPLILNDEALVNPDLVIANPRHGSFAEMDDAYCYHDSIIPKINLTIRAKMSKVAIETDAVRTLTFSWMPVYCAFLNRLDAADSKTGVSVEDILELTHETTGKSVQPIWSGNNLSGGVLGIHATPTVALMGLTGDAIIERVIFDKDLFYDALQFYTNAPMLRKCVGPMRRVTLKRDNRYFYHSNNFTHPMVKRVNDYTFCGILFSLPLVGTVEQMTNAGEVTAIDHMQIGVHCRYDEWNPDFDQTSS